MQTSRRIGRTPATYSLLMLIMHTALYIDTYICLYINTMGLSIGLHASLALHASLSLSLCVWVACPLCCKRSFIRKIFNLSSFSSSTQSQVKPNQTEPAVASASTRLACRFTSRQPVCSSSLLSSPALPLSLSVALSAPCMCANLSNIVPFPYAFHLSIFFCLYFSSARRLLLSCSCSSPAPPARALLFK